MYEVHIYDKFIICNMHIHSIARVLDILDTFGIYFYDIVVYFKNTQINKRGQGHFY